MLRCVTIIRLIRFIVVGRPSSSEPVLNAQKEVREDIQGYRKKVRRLVRRSAEEGF